MELGVPTCLLIILCEALNNGRLMRQMRVLAAQRRQPSLVLLLSILL